MLVVEWAKVAARTDGTLKLGTRTPNPLLILQNSFILLLKLNFQTS